YIHQAIDDQSRQGHSEILMDEREESAAGFWHRANCSYQASGITVRQVQTTSVRAIAQGLQHSPWAWSQTKCTPRQLQTDGRVEGFNRTMAEEWAYARQY